MDLLNQIVDLLVGGVVGVARGVGSGVNTAVTELFIATGEGAQALSNFGQIAVIWGGVALSIGLVKRILIWITSFGN